MQFIKTEELKIGMRLARPIYSKKGVLLFDRNSLLTSQAIDSVKNFGLLGIYILEPAEPLPPMSEEDLEFERFQIATVTSIQEEMEHIIAARKQSKLENLVNSIIKKYRHNDGKINFYQNLRSRDDYVCRHALNVSILCVLLTERLNVKIEEKIATISAALTHDLGKIKEPLECMYNSKLSDDEKQQVYLRQQQGMELIEEALGTSGATVRRICAQALRAQMDFDKHEPLSNTKMYIGAQILLVANRYDEITAMSLNGESESEIKAVQEFLEHPEIYDENVVQALIDSINIIIPGVSVELSTGEKALVLMENERDILRPTVLSFRDNSILDLGLRGNRDIKIVDIMKTLDNRCIMNTELLTEAGFNGGQH
jgi:HD-GYP domain-containing protein (c-di-GMP phosphodiesterase class II)